MDHKHDCPTCKGRRRIAVAQGTTISVERCPDCTTQAEVDAVNRAFWEGVANCEQCNTGKEVPLSQHEREEDS